MAGVPEYPNVEIRVNARARNYILRRVGGAFCLTVPPRASRSSILEALNELMPKLEQKLAQKNTSTAYFHQQTINCQGNTITILQTDENENHIISRQTASNSFLITVSSNLPLSNSQTTQQITNHLLNILSFIAKRTLIPLAKETAAALNVFPIGWKITKARGRNGSCTRRGSINLSCTLMLLPRELIQFVICHELAHLSHFNHSASFHKLCNSYCQKITSLSETDLQSRMRAFRSPLPR